MRLQVLTVLTVCVSVASVRSGWQPAGVTGTWVATKEAATGLSAAPTPAMGERFALRHEGEHVTVVRLQRGTASATRFVLDGREVRTRIPGGLCRGDAETIETATLDGNAIVLAVVGSLPPGGGTVARRNIRRVLRLQESDRLVVETAMSVQGELKPVATVYQRSAESLAAPPPAAEPGTPATIAQVAWIAGTWVGEMKDTTIEERWTPPSGGSMLAVGRTVRAGVMGSFEFLCVVEHRGTLVYSAMPNGRSPATDFTLTALTADSATFENPAHDFPQVIRYSRQADGSLETMVARVGGQGAQRFVLKRVDDGTVRPADR